MDVAPPLSFASIPRPAFGSAAQHLAAPPLKTTKADRRYQRAAKTAAELLSELPQPRGSDSLPDAGHVRPVPGYRHHREAPAGMPTPADRDPVLLEAQRRGVVFDARRQEEQPSQYRLGSRSRSTSSGRSCTGWAREGEPGLHSRRACAVTNTGKRKRAVAGIAPTHSPVSRTNSASTAHAISLVIGSEENTGGFPSPVSRPRVAHSREQ
jgi:hypothetical protein